MKVNCTDTSLVDFGSITWSSESYQRRDRIDDPQESRHERRIWYVPESIYYSSYRVGPGLTDTDIVTPTIRVIVDTPAGTSFHLVTLFSFALQLRQFKFAHNRTC